MRAIGLNAELATIAVRSHYPLPTACVCFLLLPRLSVATTRPDPEPRRPKTSMLQGGGRMFSLQARGHPMPLLPPEAYGSAEEAAAYRDPSPGGSAAGLGRDGAAVGAAVDADDADDDDDNDATDTAAHATPTADHGATAAAAPLLPTPGHFYFGHGSRHVLPRCGRAQH